MASAGLTMARKATPKSVPVRLSDDAVKWARIASGYTGESMAEYVSRVVCSQARKDVDDLHELVVEEEKKDPLYIPPSKPPKKR